MISILLALLEFNAEVNLKSEANLINPLVNITNGNYLFISDYYDSIYVFDKNTKKLIKTLGVLKCVRSATKAGRSTIFAGYDQNWNSILRIIDESLNYKDINIGFYVYSMHYFKEALYIGGYGGVYKYYNNTLTRFLDLPGRFVLAIKDDGSRLYILTLQWFYYGNYRMKSAIVTCDNEGRIVIDREIGVDYFSYDLYIAKNYVFVADMYASKISVYSLNLDFIKNIFVSWPQKILGVDDVVFAVDNFTDKFHLIDINTLSLVKSEIHGDDPSWITYDPETGYFYVTNYW
ncbi:MAG: hypothetical protein NZ870_02705, partial [bacterium]|nr:hypothetical protein [bacterium]